MATAHPLNAMARDHAYLARWALGRMAAAAAEDIRFATEAEHTRHRVPSDLSGRYGWHNVGLFDEEPAAPTARLRIDSASSAQFRKDEAAAGDALRSLCDPARLVSGVANASAGQCAWADGRPCIDVTLVPHPWTAAPRDPWLPPGATHLTVGVDVATGFLLHAQAHDAQGCFRSGLLCSLRTSADSRRPNCAEQPAVASAEGGATFVLARMATSLLEAVRLRAAVTTVPEIDAQLATASRPSSRSWAVTLQDHQMTTVEMSGDYEPDHADPAAARLAELLSPARIVSHLAEVTTAGPASIRATVRPIRSFPFSAWAPEGDLTCHFTIDPATGVLLRAHTMDASHTLFRAEVVTAYRTE